MKINNINISSYSASLIDRVTYPIVVNSNTDWLNDAPKGTVLGQTKSFRTLKLTFLVKGGNEDQAYKQISKLSAALEKCNLVFDDIKLSFSCLLQGKATIERVQNGVFKATFYLLNDVAVEDAINSISIDVEQADLHKITIKYFENWYPTVGMYADCFTREELIVPIKEETVYIDNSKVSNAVATSASWVSALAKLGVDCNKYKPAANNTLNGFTNLPDYGLSTAESALKSVDSIEVYYNRFQKDGELDLPKAEYPNYIWTTGKTNSYWFDLGVGKGWDIRDISFYCFGRYFDIVNTTSQSGNGSMLGAATKSDYYGLTYVAPNAKAYCGDLFPKQKKVSGTSNSSGHNIMITTLESITDVPLRKHGIHSSNEGDAALEGFADYIYNGINLDRFPMDSHILTSNLALGTGPDGCACWMEAARVQVYYKGELVKDLIPVPTNIKNGFYNDYDTCLYDVVTMEFIPWSKENGGQGKAPSAFLPKHTLAIVGPQPPKDIRLTYTLVVTKGSGSGDYAYGSTVHIKADEPEAGYMFDRWVGYGLADETLEEFDFEMPEEDVALVATYKLIPEPDKYNIGITGGHADYETAPEGTLITIEAEEPNE